MRARSTHVGGGVCGAAFVILCLPVGAAEAPAAAAATSAEPLEMVLELRINGQTNGDVFVVLIGADNALWLERQDFARLRLRPPPVTPRSVAGRE